jgi:predicted amidohydrolase
MQTDFTSIGVFHFGKDHGKPILALESAISDFIGNGGTLKNSLVVLPEGFNLGRHYYGMEPPKDDLSILDCLASLSTTFQCAFVAGLVVKDTPGVSPPYSSAYLIDGLCQPRQQILTRKKKKDSTETSRVFPDDSWVANYTACPTYEPRALSQRGLAVAALICLDAESDLESRDDYDLRCDAVAKMLSDCKCRHSLLCIPAYMSNGLDGGRIGANIILRESLRGTIHALANSCAGHVSSFITNRQGEIVLNVGRDVNQIVTAPLTQATAGGNDHAVSR